MSGARLYLVSYDIADRRRWRRAHRLVTGQGEMQQLSVYLCRLTPRQARALERALAALLDPRADRLMVADMGPAADRCAALRTGGAGRTHKGGPALPVVL